MSPLSHGELRQMEEAAKNKAAPIVVDYDTIYKELRNDLDEKIMQAVLNVGITVNKAELIRALELDKELREGKLVEVTRCRDCEYWDPGSPMATVIPAPCRCRLRRETDATTAEDFCSYGRRKEKTDER